MCCLSFAQEEKNELGLSLGAEFVPRAAITSNQKLSSESSREDWLSTSSRLGARTFLVNMEDRMLDRFADHQC